jgi:hypothetical protein
MTKEDAMLHMILRREELKHSVGDLDEDIKAFDMAIEALEQKPCEDAISRQAAISLISNHTFYADYDNIDELSLIDGLKALPPVSTEKTGHWIYKTVRGEEVPCCSRCGLDNGTYYEFKFCPECGANMIEPQESEDAK